METPKLCNGCVDDFMPSGLFMYVWSHFMDDEQYDHILDSARDHNILCVIDETDNVATFAQFNEPLLEWLKTWDNTLEFCDLTSLYYVDTSHSTK